MPPFEKEAWIGSRELTRKAKTTRRGYMMALWSSNDFFASDCVQLKVVALQKCLHAGIKTVILNTRKRNRYWKMNDT